MLRILTVVALVVTMTVACGSPTTESSSPTASVPPAPAVEPTPAATSTPPPSPRPTPTAASTPPSTPTTPGPAPTVAATTPMPTPTPLPTGVVPRRIEIPAIDVDATVIDLDIRGSAPEVPSDFDEAGWYTQTRRPGEIGPAVVAGHIDSRSGPAVFERLDELRAGDRITVHAGGGDARTFEVVDHGQYPKEALPDEVFGFGSPEPELRLITCGGTFDRSIGHYRDNYVVYARLIDTDTGSDPDGG